MRARNRAELGAYDAVVIGGGLAGVSAAYAAAKEGHKVAVVEPTGSLGREIVRARNFDVDLSRYDRQYPVVAALLDRLKARKGWFDGLLDTNCTATALDDVMDEAGVDVLFQSIESKLVTENGKAAGVEIATKSGYGLLKARYVVDASARGKLSRRYFRTANLPSGASAIHLLFNSVQGECPGEAQIEIPEFGYVAVKCRPTYWEAEWRVTFYADRYVERDQWTRLLKEAFGPLHELAPALTTGVLTYVADDVWAEPGFAVSAAVRTGTDAAATAHSDGIGELIPAGMWREGFSFDLHDEERTLMNAVGLGQSVGTSIGE